MTRSLYLASFVFLSLNSHSSWQNDILSGKTDFLKSEKFIESVSIEKISDITGDELSAGFIRDNFLRNKNLINNVSYEYIDDIYKIKTSNIDYHIDLESILNAPISTIYICLDQNKTNISEMMPAEMIKLERCDDESLFVNRIVINETEQNKYVFDILDGDKVIFSGAYTNNKNMLSLIKKYINSVGGWVVDLKIIGGNNNINKISTQINLIGGVNIMSIKKHLSGFLLTITTKLGKSSLIHKITKKINEDSSSTLKLINLVDGGLLLKISEENEFHLNIKEGCSCNKLFEKINDTGIYISQIYNSGSTIVLKSSLQKKELIKKLNLKDDEGELFYDKELVWYQWFIDTFEKIKSFFQKIF